MGQSLPLSAVPMDVAVAPQATPRAWGMAGWGGFPLGVCELQKTKNKPELGPSEDAESSSDTAPWLFCSHLEQHPNPPSTAPLSKLDPINPGTEMGSGLNPGQHWVPWDSPALQSCLSCSICRGYERAVKARAQLLIPGTQSQTRSLQAQAGSSKDPQHPRSGFQRG